MAPRNPYVGFFYTNSRFAELVFLCLVNRESSESLPSRLALATRKPPGLLLSPMKFQQLFLYLFALFIGATIARLRPTQTLGKRLNVGDSISITKAASLSSNLDLADVPAPFSPFEDYPFAREWSRNSVQRRSLFARTRALSLEEETKLAWRRYDEAEKEFKTWPDLLGQKLQASQGKLTADHWRKQYELRVLRNKRYDQYHNMIRRLIWSAYEEEISVDIRVLLNMSSSPSYLG